VEYLIIQCLCHPTGAKLKEFNCNCITVAFAVTPLLFLVWNENEDYRGFDSNPGHFVWDFWWTEWHWDGFISEYFSFTDSIMK
jgi:hypothetical protein